MGDVCGKRFLYGAYGAGNLGDDLILKAALARHWKKDEPAGCTKVVCFGSPRLREHPQTILQGVALTDPDALFTADSSLHFCGGGLFWTAQHCEEMLRLARSQKSAGGAVFVERIGAQGFHCNPDAVSTLLGIASSVSVRDRNSADLLTRYGIYDRAIVEEDYVLSLERAQPKPARSNELPIIAINHAPTPFYSDQEHRRKVIRVYTALARSFADSVRFVYLPMVRHFRCIDQNDVIVGEELCVGSGGLIASLPPFDTADALLEYFSQISAVVGWRYHLLVLARLYHIPGCFFGELDEHKYAAFVRENGMGVIDFSQEEPAALEQLVDFVRGSALC